VDVKIERGILIFFISHLISILHKIQEWLAKPIWFFGVVLPLKLVKNKDHRTQHTNFIDLDIKLHKLIYNLVQFSFIINKKVSGVVNTGEAYERLIHWNAKIPLYAYTSTETKASCRVLTYHFNDGSRGVGDFWLTQDKKIGAVQIAKTYFDNDDKYMSIVAIYTDGKYTGIKVIFKKSETIDDLEEKSKDYYPDSIYLPPKWLCNLFEVLLSLGILSTLIAIAKEAYSLIVK
jgi:hypothetical protein